MGGGVGHFLSFVRVRCEQWYGALTLMCVIEPIPDLEQFIRPTWWSDAVTYIAFGLGGVFFGGKLGFLTGSALACKYIAGHLESQKHIETAFRKFQVDVLKREIEMLEGKSKGKYSWERIKEKVAGMASSLR